MAELVVQKGEGERRPLVIAYHTAAEYLRGMHPTAAIWSFYGTPFTKQYFKAGAGVVRPLAELVARARAQGFEPDPIVLVGWSEGCQGIRAALWEGSEARKMIGGIVALDGIHAPHGGGGELYLEPWEWAYEDARDRELAFTWTVSGNVIYPTEKDPLPPESTSWVARNIVGELPLGTTDTGFFRLMVSKKAGEAEHVRQATLAKVEGARVIELAQQRSGGGGGFLGAIAGAAVGAVCGGVIKGGHGAAFGAIAGGVVGAIIGGA